MKKTLIRKFPNKSSHLEGYAYNAKTETLRIAFKDSQWDYTPVSPILKDELLAASSHGTFFHANIRNNKDITATKV